MKTSRIIFISFFAVLGFFLLSMLVTGFIFKDKQHKGRDSEHYKKEFVSLETFNHVVVADNCKLSLNSASSNKLIYSYLDNQEKIEPVMTIRNDTLYIESTKTNTNNRVELRVNSLQSLTGNSCSISLFDFKQEALSIQLDKSELSLNKKTSISDLNIKLENSSKLRGWEYTAQNVQLNCNQSVFEGKIVNRLESFNGVIKEKSEVRLPQARSYDLDLDDSSTIKAF